jgi:hypothetical protein
VSNADLAFACRRTAGGFTTGSRSSPRRAGSRRCGAATGGPPALTVTGGRRERERERPPRLHVQGTHAPFAFTFATGEAVTGRLAPWADPLTGALGWTVLTTSRDLAAAIAAVSGGKAHPGGPGQWEARIPGPAIAVTVISADSSALLCGLGSRPGAGGLTVPFAPWPAAVVLKCPVTEMPACGRLTVQDVRITTRMGRTVRYLVPRFAPS